MTLQQSQPLGTLYNCDLSDKLERACVLILDSITCVSRSGIGPLMLPPVNRTFKGKNLTSLTPSVGQRSTILRLSSIFTVLQEVKTGMNFGKHARPSPFYRLFSPVSQYSSFDNSGQRVSFPQWQNNQTNVKRMNAIVWQLAYQFQHQSQVVSVIAPLNECVFQRCVLEITC